MTSHFTFGKIVSRVLLYAVVILLSIGYAGPLIWMVSTSLKTDPQVYTVPPIWVPNPMRFANAFGSFVWPILGTIFLPWTTLMYLIVWSPVTGIIGLDWVFIGLGVLFDISTYAGGGWGNRDRLQG